MNTTKKKDKKMKYRKKKKNKNQLRKLNTKKTVAVDQKMTKPTK